MSSQQCATAGVVRALVDLIDGDVREQRAARRHSPGGQAARRGGEQPVIIIRNDADEERWNLVHVADGVVTFTGEIDEFAMYPEVIVRTASDRSDCVHDILAVFSFFFYRPRV